MKLHDFMEAHAPNSHHPFFHYIHLSPLYFLDNFILKIYDIPPFYWSYTIKPEQNKWYMSKWLNPLKLISSTLMFLHFFFINCFNFIFSSETPREVFKWVIQLLFFPLHLIAAIAEFSIDLVLISFDSLVLDPIRFIYEAVEEFINPADYLYVPSEEYKGVRNISLERNEERFHNSIIKSENYTLSYFFNDKGKKTYLEESKFYKRMKEKKYFANTDNFSIMSKDEKRTLSLLSDWKKFRQLSFFAKENA
ncbi:MAG: hypothetical protein H0T84_14810, partial [Tatlockia sp.]|nr:hypothetical protein [Tatlockia sp.]